MDNTDSDPDEPSVEAALATVEERLAATAELPVSPAASPWLGEAEAIAGDALAAVRAGNAAVLGERLSDLDRLLEGVSGTDNDRADEHLDAARAALGAAADAFDEGHE